MKRDNTYKFIEKETLISRIRVPKIPFKGQNSDHDPIFLNCTNMNILNDVTVWKSNSK